MPEPAAPNTPVAGLPAAGGPGDDATFLLNTMPWGVLVLAPDGTVAVLTPAAAALWGLPAAAVLGRLPAQVQPSVLPAGVVQALQEAAPPMADYWLPHTGQWIAMRTVSTADGRRWVYWDNVTALKQAEQTAQLSTHLLATVEEGARAGSYEVDLPTMTFRFSDGLFRLLGETPQSFVPTQDLVDARTHPDDIRELRQAFAETVALRKPYYAKRRIRRADGEWRVMEAHGNVVYDAAGAPTKLQALILDVTERQQAEAEIRRVTEQLAQQTTDLYRTLFQAIDQGYFLIEVLFDAQDRPVDMHFLEANPAAVRMTGEDFTGRRLRDISPNYEAYWFEIFGRVAQTGVGERLEQYAEPLRMWFDFYVQKVGDAQGRRVVVVFQDVTERRRNAAHDVFLSSLQDDFADLTTTDEILQATGARLGAHLQASSCNFLVVDETQDEDLEITYSWAVPDVPSVLMKFRSADYFHPGMDRDAHAGRPTVINDTQHDARARAEAYARLRIGAVLSIPFFRNGEWKYSMTVTDTEARTWRDDEVALLDAVVNRLFPRLERARAEESLRQSEERFRLFVTASSDLLYQFSPDLRYLRSLSGTPPLAAPAGSHVSWLETYIPPDNQPQVQEVVDRAVRERRTVELEHRFLRPNGSIGWSFSRAIPVFDAAGTLTEWFGAATDITLRKQAEEGLHQLTASLEQQVAERTQALQASRDQLQSIYDTSLVGMSVLQAERDADGQLRDFTIVSVNKELERETGRLDLVGKHYAQEYPGIRQTGLFELMRQAVETGQPQHTEYFYPHDGFYKWFSCTFGKLGDGLVATNLDITPRKRAEQERLRQLALLEQTEDVAPLGSWEYDRSTGAFTWSAGMYRLFGLPPGSAVVPEVYMQHAVADDRAGAETLVRHIRTGHGPLEQTLRIHAHGTVCTLKVKCSMARNTSDADHKMLGVDLDISDLTHLEAENLRIRLQQQHDLFTAVLHAQETERQRIAEGLHNGLGQTLYATKLHLTQLQQAARPGDWRRAEDLLADAIRQARTLSHELVPAVLNEFGLEAALCDMCRKLSTRQLRVACQVTLDQELAQPLQVALYRMGQELVQNIVKHAHATEASLALETVPGFVLLRAEDNGVGFGENDGTGLGLRSIRDRVALLGGTLDVGSSPRFGTYVRIRFLLPGPATAPVSAKA